MNELNLEVYEKDNLRVLTTAQLAESFDTDSKIINRNFQRNTERYIQGKHFFALTGEELKQFKGLRQIDPTLKFASVLYLWTEKGAWLHAKSLNNDKAWDAYEMLVDEYYRIKEEVKTLSPKEQLMAAMQLTLETEKEVATLKEDVNQLKEKVDNQITLDHGEQRRIQKLVASKVYEVSTSDSHRKALFPELHRELKDRFGVASYKDIKRHELPKAIGYIESWIPKKVIS